MNAELEDRPTSTGMRLRLLWRAAQGRARRAGRRTGPAVRQTSDAWSPEDRAAVGEFLQAQIAEVRARTRPAPGWSTSPRRWTTGPGTVRRSSATRTASGSPATGPASGGERVLAASVPLFAAASSHYASAGNPHAPRLITLDEAFAGVDDDSRAKCLGLLAAFDLDVVMTSEREWGCYPEVPGSPSPQLSRADEHPRGPGHPLGVGRAAAIPCRSGHQWVRRAAR